MSRVIVIGAHGKVALLATPLLVGSGHEVTGVVRKPEQEGDIREAGAAPTVADVEQMSTEQLTGLVEGHDVVVWSAGAGGGSPERTWSVDRDAAVRVVDATVAAGVDRFVMVSYFGAGPDHGVDPDSDFYAYAEAKTEADQHLAGTSLAWTILRPSSLTDDAAGGIEPGGSQEATQVPRATVAEVIARVVDHPASTGRLTLPFNEGDRSVDTVVAAS